MTFQAEAADLPRHLEVVNGLLMERELAPLVAGDLVSGPNQLKCPD
jgi:hypothetical protein